MASVNVAFGSRPGREHRVSQDVLGLNGWALHAPRASIFPTGPSGELSFEVTKQAAGVIALADGHGGTAGGQAAALVTASLVTAPAVATGKSALVAAVNQAHASVLDLGAESPDSAKPGSTVVGVLVQPHGGVKVFHVGDSRAYSRKGGTLVRLTSDHVDPSFDASLPRRLRLWLGRPDLPTLDPTVFAVDAAEPLLLLLCSDGVTDRIDEHTLQGIVCGTNPEPSAIVAALLSAAEGGEDDATVAAIMVAPQKRWRPFGSRGTWAAS